MWVGIFLTRKQQVLLKHQCPGLVLNTPVFGTSSRGNLVSSQRVSPSKQSGEWNQISWAYSPQVVRINKIPLQTKQCRLEGTQPTLHDPPQKAMKIARSILLCSTSLTTITLFISTWVSVLFFKRVWQNLLQGNYTVAKAGTRLRNLTWFTRPFLLVMGWGLGTRLGLRP